MTCLKKKVRYGTSKNILKDDIVFIDNPDLLMKSKGYFKAERVNVVETKTEVGVDDDFPITQYDFKEFDPKITFVREEWLNKKDVYYEDILDDLDMRNTQTKYILTRPLVPINDNNENIDLQSNSSLFVNLFKMVFTAFVESIFNGNKAGRAPSISTQNSAE